MGLTRFGPRLSQGGGLTAEERRIIEFFEGLNFAVSYDIEMGEVLFAGTETEDFIFSNGVITIPHDTYTFDTGTQTITYNGG